MDFGYPQTTESKILQEYITQESHKLEVIRPPVAVTNAVSWRSEGIRYRKNEVFLDVVESVNLLVSETSSQVCNTKLMQYIISPLGQRQRERDSKRDSRSCKNEMLSLWYARTETRIERQGHVREHGTR